jgi:hypothetical protein
MFTVCDSSLRVVFHASSMGAAREAARLQSIEHPGHVFFVCNTNGMVWHGYWNDGRLGHG